MRYYILGMFLIAFYCAQIPHAHPDTSFNYELTYKSPSPIATHDHILLIYSAPDEHIVQDQIMTFIVKVVDTKTLTDALPYDVFNGDQGNLNNANITVKLENSTNYTLYIWHGKSNQFGLYTNNIQMLQYPTNQEYHLVFIAQKQGMYNYTSMDYFELYDARDISDNWK